MNKLGIYLLFSVSLVISGCSKNQIGRMIYSTKNTKASDYINEGFRYQDNFADELARKSFQNAIDADPEFAFAYYCLAWITPDRIERDKIVKLGEQYLSNANSGEKSMIDPMVKAMSGDEINWQEWVEKFSPLYPNETRYINFLGNIANNAGDKEKAEVYYNKSLSIQENAAALNSLAYFYNGQGKLEKAKDALDRQLMIAPDLANPYDSMGDYYLEKNNNKKAKEYFEKALEIDPKFLMSSRKIWRIEMDGNGNKVEPYVWSSDSTNSITLFKTGLWEFYNIHWQKARENFEAAIKIDPQFAMPYLYLLLTPGDSLRSEKARATLATISGNASQFEKDFIDFNLYWRDNQKTDVDFKINELKVKYPSKHLVMLLDGLNHFRKKEFKVASSIYTKIWDRFNFAPALNMIGYSNMRAENMSAAKNAFVDYISNNGDHPNPYDSMGEYLENMKEYDNAYKYYMMAFNIDSTFSLSKVRADSLLIKQQVGNS